MPVVSYDVCAQHRYAGPAFLIEVAVEQHLGQPAGTHGIGRQVGHDDDTLPKRPKDSETNLNGFSEYAAAGHLTEHRSNRTAVAGQPPTVAERNAICHTTIVITILRV